MRAGRLVTLGLLIICAVAAQAPAVARTYVPPGHHIYAGLTGGDSITAYQKMVGKHPAVFETFMTWNTPTAWLRGRDRGFRSRLALHIGTSTGYGKPGVITPQQIANGRSDAFLVDLGRNLAHSQRVVYIRLMAEMNGHWNAYAAYNANGSFRGITHSPHSYIQAWRRSVLLLRGGPVARINRRLHRLGLPRLKVKTTRGEVLARPKVTFLWVPQDAGSPEIAANAPAAFWPGAAYVDWVGTDFYASYPNFTLLDQFYNEFGHKPFVLSEWGLYGSDDPQFVRALFAWVHTHPRLRMLNYYQGFDDPRIPALSKSNLAHYPRSRRALRSELRSRQFLAYPPEYSHPYKPPAHSHPGPPHNPQPAPGPTPPVPQAPSPPPSSPTPPTSPTCVLQICLPVLGPLGALP
ncbi:MAG: hypothetical protein WAK93_21540 [Solirubrobacteraceae bacterium]